MAEKKKMKKWLKAILIILAVLIVIIAAFTIFITFGMSDTQNAKISEVNLSAIPDGIYTGEFSGNRWANTLEVTVTDGKITDIKTIKDQMTKSKGFAQKVFDAVIAKQSLQIDVVSGATVTTKGYLLAIENALMNKK